MRHGKELCIRVMLGKFSGSAGRVVPLGAVISSCNNSSYLTLCQRTCDWYGSTWF